MFYEFRIFDPKRKIKKIITTKQLSRRHWSEFEKQQKGFASPRIRNISRS